MQHHHQSKPSGFRPIVPAPPAPTFITVSPHGSPQVNPSPQQNITLPPFETPPVSPFSNPMHHDYSGQNIFKLPPPIQPLPSLNIHGTQPMILPPSPTNIITQQPKHTSSSTTIFSIPITTNQTAPVNSTVSSTSNSRPTMQHHTSIIHPLVPHHNNRGSVSSDKPLTTADQRELARKVSHSAIERRRRERINDKIMQLKELIPSCADQDHLHKLNILQSAIDYIQYLQGIVGEYRQKEREGTNNSDEGRTVKKSKFDRYEIPIPKKKISKEEFENDEKEYKHKKSSVNVTTPQKNPDSNQDRVVESPSNQTSSQKLQDHEEANALLMLSNSIVQESNQKVQTRDSQTQTSIDDVEDADVENLEVEVDSPRRGMTVQHLLC